MKPMAKDKITWFIDFESEEELNSYNRFKIKQVRTNIGLADTLIPSSFINFSYVGGNGPCDSSKIIFGNHAYS